MLPPTHSELPGRVVHIRLRHRRRERSPCLHRVALLGLNLRSKIDDFE